MIRPYDLLAEHIQPAANGLPNILSTAVLEESCRTGIEVVYANDEAFNSSWPKWETAIADLDVDERLFIADALATAHVGWNLHTLLQIRIVSRAVIDERLSQLELDRATKLGQGLVLKSFGYCVDTPAKPIQNIASPGNPYF